MDEDNQIVVSFGFWTSLPLNQHTENRVRSNIITALENECSKRVEKITLNLSSENVWVHVDSYSMSYDHMKTLIEKLGDTGRIHNPTVTTLKQHRKEFSEMELEPPL